MKKEVIGHIDCPTCGFAHMEVKEDKNEKAFGFCPDCATQVFTRNDYRDKRLRARMRPVSVTVTEPAAKPAQPVTVTEPKAPTVPAAKPAAPKPAPAAKPTPPATPEPTPQKPQPKKTGWLTPLIGS